MKIITNNIEFYNTKDLNKEQSTKLEKDNSKFRLLALTVMLLSLFFSSTATAHRGAKNEIDTCRISVGNEVVHFSAYTPVLGTCCQLLP